MKKITICCLLFAVCAASAAHAAIAIKRAEPVATNESAGTQGAASLVPSLLGLVSGVQAVNAQQNQLTQECLPSTAEMNFVDTMMKEWAKTGRITRAEMQQLVGREPCQSDYTEVAKDCYSGDVSMGVTPGIGPRYNVFAGAGNTGMVWEGFPKTGRGYYCKDGAITCDSRDRTAVTDVYDLFNLIDFEPEDYLPTEASMAANLLRKVQICSTTKLSAKKKELWGAFLIDTATSLGQPTNTGTIMDTVGTMIQNGPSGGIGSIGAIAQQFLAK